MNMVSLAEEFTDIIQKRTIPGILIFDGEKRLIDFNSEAASIFPDMAALQHEIHALCESAAQQDGHRKPNTDGNCCTIHRSGESVYSVREVRLNGHNGNEPPLRMILIERIILKHYVDIEKVKQEFNLTKRECEVIKLISLGFCNKSIAEKLHISEHTTKDHVKNIMRKVNAKSRSEIMAMLAAR